MKNEIVGGVLFLLSLVAVYCGYQIIADMTLVRDGASMIPGMRTAGRR